MSDASVKSARSGSVVVGRNRPLCIPFSIWLALGFLGLMVLVAIFAPLIAPYDFASRNLARRLRPPVFWGSDWIYPLGTDNLGRDILSRLLFGVQTSIAVAFAGTLIGAALGTALGYLASRRRGIVDETIMMMVDVQAALPAFFIALACIAAPWDPTS